MSDRRVVVTGIGMLTPLASTSAESWRLMREGQSGIAPIASFDADGFPVRIAGEVPEFDVGEFLPPKEARRMDGFIQHGLVAGIQAVQDSGFEYVNMCG